MSRRLRFIPEGGALVEVTCRALHSRFLFCPRPLMNEIIIGTLARAKQHHEVQVCFFVGVSNHMHLLLWVEDARGLAKFMGYFLSKLAREVGRLTGWKEKIFGRRYQAIVVSDEEAAQVERLRYPGGWILGRKTTGERVQSGESAIETLLCDFGTCSEVLRLDR